MEKLCTDVVENVLCRLPIETALQAKRVCKTWRFLLRSKTDKFGVLFFFSYDDVNKNQLCYGDDKLYDPIRGKMTYNFSYDKLEDKMHNRIFFLNIDILLGSCNGLVCIRTYLFKTFLICNPLTGEVVSVPMVQNCSLPDDLSGFGYCHSTNEYKIVRIHSDCRELKQKYHVQVYTVGGGGEWRTKKSINFGRRAYKESIYISPLYPEGICANGSIHWLHLRRSKNTHRNHDYKIVAFDLEDEKFWFLPLPHLQDAKYPHRPYSDGPNLLGPRLLGGKNLYFVDTFYDEEQYHTDIWAYKRTNTNSTACCDRKENNYVDQNSWHWIKEFSIEWEEPYWKVLWSFEPMAITGNNELLLRCGTTLYCYDFKTSTYNELFDGSVEGCNMIRAIPHVNSIVSIPLKDHAHIQDRQLPLDDSMAHGNYSYVYAYGALFFLLVISFKFLFPHFLD